LAGTLTKPNNTISFPTVILISGSGPQDRNSELMGHKPFLVIAEYLSNNGIAVLRIDDRGVGESTGDHNSAHLSDFVNDTQSAFEYLTTRKDLDSKKIGLIGHSLGGVIAPIVASKNNDLDFIILLAGTGMRGDKLMLLQKEIIERRMGITEPNIELGQKNIRGAYDIILNHGENESQGILKIKIQTYFTKVFGEALTEKQIKALSDQLSTPWLVDFIKFEPTDALNKVSCPTLALNGTMDTQVPVENLNLINDALVSGGNLNVKTIEIPKHNHLFQKCETGLPSEYGILDESFSTKVLKIMSKWIVKTTK
jgi:pimeloyl-ACP methyl ester carboxylesterase